MNTLRLTRVTPPEKDAGLIDPPCPDCGHLATFHDGQPCDHPAIGVGTLCGCTYVTPSEEKDS